MADRLQGRATLTVVGLAAAVVVATLVGVLTWNANPFKSPGLPSADRSPSAGQAGPGQAGQPQASPPAPPGQASLEVQPVPPTGDAPLPTAAAGATAVPPLPAPPAAAAPPVSGAASPPTTPALAGAPASPPIARQAPGTEAAPNPSFDIVRVEPSGESVIAGRAPPGATVEMLRDGEVHAKAVADASGLFALVPPPLPAGSSRITLQSIAPDGQRQLSGESVTVAIGERRDSPPLVALTQPDKPTVVLSTPAPRTPTAGIESSPAQAPPSPAPRSEEQTSLRPPPAAPPAQPAAPRANVKILSVEAEEGGRLYVSGEAVPGAAVRLYLNETLVAPGGVGGDGKVSFVIARGVRPGDYRVRIDDVDPATGTVKSRAEVAFNVPPALAAAVPQAPTAVVEPQQLAAAPTPQAQSVASQSAASPQNAGSRAAAASVAPATVVPGTAAPSAPSSPAELAGAPLDTRGIAQTQRPASTSPGANTSADRVAAVTPQVREFPAGAIVIPDINTAIVARGENLWRISHRVYGRGLRYTVIYQANLGQIRNPNRIYPGQVFVIPADEPRKVR